MSALDEIVEFVNADRDRFMTLSYYGGTASYAWEFSVFLGANMTCTGVWKVDEDRWLKVQAASQAEVLEKAVARLATVRRLASAR